VIRQFLNPFTTRRLTHPPGLRLTYPPVRTFGVREPAQGGWRSQTQPHLNSVPQRNSPHVAPGRSAHGPRPVVVGCSSKVLQSSPGRYNRFALVTFQCPPVGMCANSELMVLNDPSIVRESTNTPWNDVVTLHAQFGSV
jgi:hypothetical protein